MMGDAHPGELKLRRLLAGELSFGEAAEQREHAGTCHVCRTKLKELEEEQHRFEAEIPFERFAAGVERAERRARPGFGRERNEKSARRRWVYTLSAIAAMLAVSIATRTLIPEAERALNRTKGGSSIEIIVAGPANGPQRQSSADPTSPEPLSTGERIRIGYTSGDHRFLAAVSIDQRGEVTPLYPERGKSLPVSAARQRAYLPDSVEFTGEGAERVVVVLTDEPLQIEQVVRAARAAYQRAGELSRLDRLDLPGEQFHRMFLKP